MWHYLYSSSSTNGSLSLFRLEEQDKAPTKKRQKRKRNVIPWTLGRSPGKAPLSVYFFVSPQHGSVVFVVGWGFPKSKFPFPAWLLICFLMWEDSFLTAEESSGLFFLMVDKLYSHQSLFFHRWISILYVCVFLSSWRCVQVCLIVQMWQFLSYFSITIVLGTSAVATTNCRKKYVPKHERFFFMCPLNASFKVSKENSSFDGPIIVNFGTRFQHFFVELVVVVLVPCNYNIIVVLCSFCNCSLESSWMDTTSLCLTLLLLLCV